jgi:hypothetical protein
MAWSPPGASTPGFGCRFSTGDYATPISPTTSSTAPEIVGQMAITKQSAGLLVLF